MRVAGAARAPQVGAARAVIVRHAVAGRTRGRNVVLAGGYDSLTPRNTVPLEQSDHVTRVCEGASLFATPSRIGRGCGAVTVLFSILHDTCIVSELSVMPARKH